MRETESELDELQELLNASRARATEHLRSIMTPERVLTARQLTAVLTGMCVLSVATVTAAGEPRVSGIDGHFLHGRWIFGTSRTAAKARHLAARPAVSVAHLRGDAELGVFAHGTAQPLNPAGGPDDPQWPAVLEYLTGHYGNSPLTWGDVVYFRLRPSWMTAFAADPDALAAERA